MGVELICVKAVALHMSPSTIAVVLAGGTGTRLYPASRPNRPKQFLELFNDESLLSQTLGRTEFADETLVLTTPGFADEVRNYAPDTNVIVEPEPKDTGPTMVYAAHCVTEQFEESVVCCLPTDHYVDGDFESPIVRAIDVAAATDGLVVLGVNAAGPVPGHGYIEPGPSEGFAKEVVAFHEKPSVKIAREYVRQGWYWNTGIYVWRPESLLAAATDSPLAPLVTALRDGDPAAGYAAVHATSIEYGVFERASDRFLVPAEFTWNDVGSWDGVWRAFGPEESNLNLSFGETLELDAAGNVAASDDKHITIVGVKDLVVAAFDDRVLVIPRDQAQRTREVVDRLSD